MYVEIVPVRWIVTRAPVIEYVEHITRVSPVAEDMLLDDLGDRANIIALCNTRFGRSANLHEVHTIRHLLCWMTG